MLVLLTIMVISCTSMHPAASTGEPADSAENESEDNESTIETVPGWGEEEDDADEVFDPLVVHEITITLTDDAVEGLRTDPTSWVKGQLVFAGKTWEQVGFRLKGSSSYQDFDEKPAWKIKLDEYVEGQRLHGLERLTLNNEVWDPTMMAENMAYRAFRENGSPAPRTGYAAVTANDRYLGLYAIIESMDDAFIDHTWPDSNGGLWEMTRMCDFTSDCSCFDLQETGNAYEADGIVQGCDAVAVGTVDALKDAFDWDALIAFLAVERVVNHPDSYSFNLNNFFVYHDPVTDRLSLSPWGADSTFVYIHPPSADNPDCEPLYLDVDTTSMTGWLGGFCLSDSTCRQDLLAAMLVAAEWMESADLVGEMETTTELLAPYAPLETWVNWNLKDRDKQVDCFVEWTAARPEEVRTWVSQW